MRTTWRCLVGLCGVLFLSGCIAVDLGSLLSQDLQEVEISRDQGWGVKDKVLLVDVSGVIMDKAAGGWAQDRVCTPDYMGAVLRRAANDPMVKAVVLRIDSPGGSASAADTISHQIDQFTKQTGRPVFAVITGLGCSGGYHVACSAEKIFSHPSAITGSIGVITVLPKIAKLADKIGLEQEVIKSGNMKDMGNMLRDMSQEERKVFQAIIDDLYNQFVERVALRRPGFKTQQEVRPIADGRIYTASQAVANKLVDQIGHVDHVVRAIKVKAGLKRARLVMYRYNSGGDMTLYSPVSRAALPEIKGMDLPLPESLRLKAGFYYLWQPGL